MQDNKALQAGTSHHLGQNFAKAFDTKFQTAEGNLEYVWSTSWGVSTRLVGGLIMSHSDDKGLVCPPRLAPAQVVIVPIWRSDDQRSEVLEVANRVKVDLVGQGLRVELDERDMKPGAKYYEWEARGVPVRLELGPRDIAADQAVMVRRTGGGKESVGLEGLGKTLVSVLDDIQQGLLTAAQERREQNSVRGISKDDLVSLMDGPGGFAYGGFCGNDECETKIKEKTKATVRVLPDAEFRSSDVPAKCVWCGHSSVVEAVWAKAY
jgi:prolyl-tRNA synthetase